MMKKLLTLLLLSPLAFAEEPNVKTHTEEELRNMQTLEQWGEVWINGNYELVQEIVNPIYIRHEPTGTIHIKREQYAERIKSMRDSNRTFTTQSLSADGDLIWVRWSMETEDPQTKDITHSRGVQAYRFEEGRLAETWWSLTEGHGSWLDK